jgi:hypothetical protein
LRDLLKEAFSLLNKGDNPLSLSLNSLFVSLVYCAENTVRWFVVREKHCWMAADSADKSKRTGRKKLADKVLGNLLQ